MGHLQRTVPLKTRRLDSLPATRAVAGRSIITATPTRKVPGHSTCSHNNYSCGPAASKLSQWDNFDAAVLVAILHWFKVEGPRPKTPDSGQQPANSGSFELVPLQKGDLPGDFRVVPPAACRSVRCTSSWNTCNKASGSAASKLSQWDNFDVAVITPTKPYNGSICSGPRRSCHLAQPAGHWTEGFAPVAQARFFAALYLEPYEPSRESRVLRVVALGTIRSARLHRSCPTGTTSMQRCF